MKQHIGWKILFFIIFPSLSPSKRRGKGEGGRGKGEGGRGKGEDGKSSRIFVITKSFKMISLLYYDSLLSRYIVSNFISFKFDKVYFDVDCLEINLSANMFYKAMSRPLKL